MFDIGFSEIVVIGVVALVVIGPERLPKTARTLGHLFGRLQRYVNDVKADINREMELDELRKLQREVQSAARDFEQSVDERRDATSQIGRAQRRARAERRRRHAERRPRRRRGARTPSVPDAGAPRRAGAGRCRASGRSAAPAVAARLRADRDAQRRDATPHR